MNERNTTLQAQPSPDAGVSDEDLRALWRQHGGMFHGPLIETGTMPEAKLLAFLRAILALRPAQQSESEPFGYFRALPFGWEQCSETDEGAVALYERPQSAQQAVPMTEPVQRLRRYAGQTMRTARNPNITARDAIAIGDYLAAIGITQRADGGEG